MSLKNVIAVWKLYCSYIIMSCAFMDIFSLLKFKHHLTHGSAFPLLYLNTPLQASRNSFLESGRYLFSIFNIVFASLIIRFWKILFKFILRVI